MCAVIAPARGEQPWGRRKEMTFSFLGHKTYLALGTALFTSVVVGVAYAQLPARTVDPSTVPVGTLATTTMDVLSVSAFTRAINQAGGGTNTVLQHLRFTPGQSTLWHTHPGPNLVLVVGGSLTLTDQHCHVTTYFDGQGFATGLTTHLAVAGPAGADFYSLYYHPAAADVLREPPAGVSGDVPNCAQ
jgi:hypothetical protein